jgi:hypothetical protein
MPSGSRRAGQYLSHSCRCPSRLWIGRMAAVERRKIPHKRHKPAAERLASRAPKNRGMRLASPRQTALPRGRDRARVSSGAGARHRFQPRQFGAPTAARRSRELVDARAYCVLSHREQAVAPRRKDGRRSNAPVHRRAAAAANVRHVTLRTDPTQATRDSFGRLLAYVTTLAGRNLSVEELSSMRSCLDRALLVVPGGRWRCAAGFGSALAGPGRVWRSREPPAVPHRGANRGTLEGVGWSGVGGVGGGGGIRSPAGRSGVGRA